MNVSKKGAILLSSLGLIAGVAGTIAMQTHAATTTGSTAAGTAGFGYNRQLTPPVAYGSVTAVSGNTITLTDKNSGAVYTVDAGSAVIEKMPAAAANGSRPTPETISVSGIAIGDNITVHGTVSGTSITATKIMDGAMGGFGGRGGHMGRRGTVGTVASVSGSTITLTGADGKTYTVNAGSAAVRKVSTIAVSDIQAGDTLMVNGTTSGTTITANNIVDGALHQTVGNQAGIK